MSVAQQFGFGMKSEAVPQCLIGLRPTAHGREQVGPHSEKEYLEVSGYSLIDLDFIEDVERLRMAGLVREDDCELNGQMDSFREEPPSHPQQLFGSLKIADGLERVRLQVTRVR